MCHKLQCRWSKATGIVKRSAEISVCCCVLFEWLCTQSDYCRMVGFIVQLFIAERMWHLAAFVQFLISVFVSDFTVHGCRALWKGAGNSWAWKNRKGSCIKNAIIWHEGKRWDDMIKVCPHVSKVVIEMDPLLSSDYRLWSYHSSWGVSQLGGGADVTGAALASVWLHHCPHSFDALYCWWV